MKKKLIALTASAIMALSLSGCMDFRVYSSEPEKESDVTTSASTTEESEPEVVEERYEVSEETWRRNFTDRAELGEGANITLHSVARQKDVEGDDGLIYDLTLKADNGNLEIEGKFDFEKLFHVHYVVQNYLSDNPTVYDATVFDSDYDPNNEVWKITEELDFPTTFKSNLALFGFIGVDYSQFTFSESSNSYISTTTETIKLFEDETDCIEVEILFLNDLVQSIKIEIEYSTLAINFGERGTTHVVVPVVE